MASKSELSEEISFDVETKFLTADNVSAFFKFGKDEIDTEVGINHLTKPILMEYYNKAEELWN